jgi:phenylacetic acid degradation operon negative regulatory protein
MTCTAGSALGVLQGGVVNARAAVFDLYGDHLRERGGEASISAIIRLLDALDIAAPAVRTAVSRMVRQGWLEPVRRPSGPGYRLTNRAWRRLDEAAVRIFGKQDLDAWDGRWSVLVVERTNQRSRRERLARGLEYLGFRQLDPNAWVAPRGSLEAEAVISAEGLRFDEFHAEFAGESRELVDRLYSLRALAAAYRRWLDNAETVVAATTDEPDDRAAFAARAELLHEWRKFLFRDPGLPTALVPADWPGTAARRYFDAQAERLLPGARAYVDHCLNGEKP